jgi:hypothetical protein
MFIDRTRPQGSANHLATVRILRNTYAPTATKLKGDGMVVSVSALEGNKTIADVRRGLYKTPYVCLLCGSLTTLNVQKRYKLRMIR